MVAAEHANVSGHRLCAAQLEQTWPTSAQDSPLCPGHRAVTRPTCRRRGRGLKTSPQRRRPTVCAESRWGQTACLQFPPVVARDELWSAVKSTTAAAHREAAAACAASGYHEVVRPRGRGGAVLGHLAPDEGARVEKPRVVALALACRAERRDVRGRGGKKTQTANKGGSASVASATPPQSPAEPRDAPTPGTRMRPPNRTNVVSMTDEEWPWRRGGCSDLTSTFVHRLGWRGGRGWRRRA